MTNALWGSFIQYFATLLVLLLAVKAVLILYRMKSGRWPRSAKYLIGIIEWHKEAAKIFLLALLALLGAFLAGR